MRILWFIVSALLVIVTHVIGLRLAPSWFTAYVDPGLVMITYYALASRPVPAMLIASLLGLIHDSLTGGLYGLYGFADTLVAFGVSQLRQHFVLHHLSQMAVSFALAAVLQSLILVGLGFLLVPDTPLPGPTELLGRLMSTIVIGLVVIATIRRLSGWNRRRKRRSSSRLRLGTS